MKTNTETEIMFDRISFLSRQSETFVESNSVDVNQYAMGEQMKVNLNHKSKCKLLVCDCEEKH